MFCSFDSAPLILRLYGTGHVVRPGSGEWDELIPDFPRLPGERQIIRIAVSSLQTSCGYAVPRMELIEPRMKLVEWASGKTPEELNTYRRTKNVKSIDGFPTPFSQEN
jgi:hypothetical protein